MKNPDTGQAHVDAECYRATKPGTSNPPSSEYSHCTAAVRLQLSTSQESEALTYSNDNAQYKNSANQSSQSIASTENSIYTATLTKSLFEKSHSSTTQANPKTPSVLVQPSLPAPHYYYYCWWWYPVPVGYWYPPYCLHPSYQQWSWVPVGYCQPVYCYPPWYCFPVACNCQTCAAVALQQSGPHQQDCMPSSNEVSVQPTDEAISSRPIQPKDEASLPLIQPKDEASLPLIQPKDEASLPIIQPKDEASLPIIQPKDEASLPLIQPKDEASLPLIQPKDEASLPIIQPKDEASLPLTSCLASKVKHSPFPVCKNRKVTYSHSVNQASYRDVLSHHRVALLLRVCVVMIALLLLLAGDVERNPGPTVVAVDKVDELAALLCEEAAEWYLFLGQLGVSKGKRDEIREEMAGRPRAAQKCLTEGLHHWVVSDDNPTYEKIIAVFNGNFLTNRPLARKVEEFAQSVEANTGGASPMYSCSEASAAPKVKKTTAQASPSASRPRKGLIPVVLQRLVGLRKSYREPTVLSIEHLDQLQVILLPIANQWRTIAKALKVRSKVRKEVNRTIGNDPTVQKIDDSNSVQALTEILIIWLTRQTSRPTLEALIDAIRGCIAQNHPLANSLQQMSHQQQSQLHASTTDDAIAGYVDQMRRYYGTAIPQCFSLTWPPPPTRKVFNLSIISHKQYNYGKGNNELVRLLYLGNVEEVMKTTSNVNLDELFCLDKAERKVVLIEGAPGAGKSTLAWHICQKWKSGDLFQEFKLVVFVQLRDPAIQSAKSLADLFPAQLKSLAREAVSRMENKGGEGLLFVLDGWDEFPPGLRGNELIENLICNPVVVAMPCSTLLITSRPIASGDLHQYASSRVETIGFKITEMNLYFKEALQNDSDRVKQLHTCLKKRPVIKASCYLPLNAVIVVHLFLSLDNSLPNTLHGVFLQLVIHCIVRHIMKQQGDDNEPPHISSLDDLPRDMQTQLSHICSMAYHGVMENKVTFSEDDLKSFNLPTNISTLSLIQVVVSFMPYRSLSYNFLHLSVQELLTSYHISKLPPAEQVKIFKELFGQPRFAAVFQYYAAFTKLKTEGIQNIIVSIIEHRDSNLLLTLLHCLYEAQDASMCQFVASELKGELSFGKSLSPVDCIAIGYFFHQCATACPMTVNLPQCSLDSYKLELFVKELKQPIQAVQSEICLDFSSNNYDGQIAQVIGTELIMIGSASEDVSSTAISKLNLSDNPIQDGEDGLSHLSQALSTNTFIVELNLSNCRLSITEENAGTLIYMLKTNKTLNVLVLSHNAIDGRGVRYLSEVISLSAYSTISKLDLSHNPIQDGEDGLSHLSQALSTNTFIVELNLSNCKLSITEENAGTLIHMLKTNKTLNMLVLSHNAIDGRGVRYLSEFISLSAYSTISKLDLSHNPIQDGEDGFSHLCQALATNNSLVELNLTNCALRITDENGRTLNHMLKTNKTLKQLEISPLVNTNGRGVRYLSEVISFSSAIRKLDLSDSPIQDGEDGFSHLCQALATNNSLVELNLTNCALRITDENGRTLNHMLKTNKTLKQLKISPLVNTNGRGVRYLSEVISFSSAIRKLDLSDNPIQDGEDGLSHLCQALTTNTSLVELKFAGFTLRVSGTRQGEMAEAIKSLQLSNQYITRDIIVRSLSYFIASSSAISKLDLSSAFNNQDFNSEFKDGLSHLFQALTTNTSLVELNLSSCGLSITKESFTHMLKTNKTLNVFALSHNAINGCGLRYLAEGISSSSAISKLDLSRNPIQDGEDGLSHLCQALITNTSLLELNLSRCELHEQCGPLLCHMLKKNRTLTSINLSRNDGISDQNVVSIAKGLRNNHSIKCLNLRWCDIHDLGMKSLTDCLMVNDSLEELILWHNTISPEATCYFSDMLKHNNTLKKLNLLQCELTDEAVRSLVSALEVNSSLEKLNLDAVTDAALVALGKSLKRNTGLKTLGMGSYGDKTTTRGWTEFVQCLKENHSLEVLNTFCHELDMEAINTVRRSKNIPELQHKSYHP